MKAKTFAKTLEHVEVEALVDTFPDTLFDRVAKTIPDTLTCVEAEPQVKKSCLSWGSCQYDGLHVSAL